MIAPLAKKFPSLTKNPKFFAKAWSLWLPFLAMGIKIERIADDFREIDVSMNLNTFNTNYVNTHFGGSLYAMTDPFYMIMMIKNLGRDYIVWDKHAAINFKKPGKGKVRANFKITEEDIQHVIKTVEADEKKRMLWTRDVHVLDEADELVTLVAKTLYIRKKPVERS